jgi:predicted HTH transcriptional regulator
VWGVDDTHAIVGTTVKPKFDKIGNEELESWLLQKLAPKLNFRFHEVTVEGYRVVLLEIERARGQPTQFAGIEYCRIGSYKKKLKDHPQKERELWRVFDRTPFEDSVAREHVSPYEVLKLLDYPRYFTLIDRPLPSNQDHILTALEEDRLIRKNDAGTWDIANLGAILFAKRLVDFGPLGRKTVLATLKEHVEPTGYAAGFEGLIKLINGLIPANEVVGQALRKTVPMYPEPAVRELVANALIHQDFFITGAGPMIEIFSDRMEVTNPGEPLVATERFVDNPPRSRNESLASLMRRMGICEERGSGVDKVVSETEQAQLPAPLFEVPDDSTRAILFAHRPLTKMDRADRVRACYLHACLRYVNREYLTNASLRERFGLDEKNSATASRFIKEAVEDGAIVPADEGAARKLMKYMPRWAQALKSKKG